jgi:Trypsin
MGTPFPRTVKISVLEANMKFVKWIVVIALLCCSPSARCVTNSTLDNTLHPNVGTIVAEYLTPGVKDQACSGTLISRTVFLTAGHCIFLLQNMFGVSQVWVTFDPVFSPSVTLYPGTMHLNPAFPGTGSSDPEDLGMIVLDSPVVGITPAALPSLGLLDRMFAEGSLSNTQFTIVGYGATDTVFGGGPPDARLGRGIRRYATEGFTALNPDLLRLNMNAIFGYGGSNTGDSGGPNFLGAGSNETSIIAAITIGGDRWGIEQNVAYRLDTPEARAFLGHFVILP